MKGGELGARQKCLTISDTSESAMDPPLSAASTLLHFAYSSSTLAFSVFLSSGSSESISQSDNDIHKTHKCNLFAAGSTAAKWVGNKPEYAGAICEGWHSLQPLIYPHTMVPTLSQLLQITA